MKELSDQEIKQRLIRLRNLEHLYSKQKIRIQILTDENRVLKKKVAMLEDTVAHQQETIEDFKLQIEELKIMVFGKKNDKNRNIRIDPPSEEEKTPRTPDSYKRPVPDESQITQVKRHSIGICPCGAKTARKKILIFYEEDIPIPAQKIVTKHEVEKAYCENCKQWHQAVKIPKSKTVLGPNVKKYACYLSVMCRLSFTQIQNLLYDTYQIKISQGEISNIIEKEAIKQRPAYEQLKERIRGEPAVHLDETGWKLLTNGENSFSWVMSGSESKESAFLIGENRGKGNAEKLMGENYDGFVITDDYAAYKKLKNHQLCWAHLLRKFRDLANSQELDEIQIQHCVKEYHKLCLIYSDLKNNRRIENYDKFFKRLTDFSKIIPDDLKKAVRLKTTLQKNIPNYLTCLKDPSIPLTNNQAERSLRHLVLKRKISFGSLTRRTAENLAVLLSVMTSLKQRCQLNFFAQYLKA